MSRFGMSKSEAKVMFLMYSGKTNGQIAEERFVCYKTIQFHITRSFKRMGVKNRDEAIALMRGLFDV